MNARNLRHPEAVTVKYSMGIQCLALLAVLVPLAVSGLFVREIVLGRIKPAEVQMLTYLIAAFVGAAILMSIFAIYICSVSVTLSAEGVKAGRRVVPWSDVRLVEVDVHHVYSLSRITMYFNSRKTIPFWLCDSIGEVAEMVSRHVPAERVRGALQMLLD